MCLLVFGFDIHPDYKFIFAGNRDEFYERQTTPASIWGDNIKVLSGLDLKCGGTWLGITIKDKPGNRVGDFSVITNFRDFHRFPYKSEKISRGLIVKNFLLAEYEIKDYKSRYNNFVNWLQSNKDLFNPFNLLFGNFDELYLYTNTTNDLIKIEKGIHGLSNQFFNDSEPKLIRAKKLFGNVINNSTDLIDDLLQVLTDDKKFDLNLIPDTGIPRELEHSISSIFVRTEKYGTRSSTIILVDRENNLTFHERSFDKNGDSVIDKRFELNLKQ